MQKHLKQFSVNDVKMFNEKIEDRDFSIVEIWAFAEGNNSHRNPISREVLHKDADTFKGKFVVAKFDKFARDVKGHETDEVIVGYVDPRETIEFKEKEVDGETKEFVVVKALLSKVYAKDIIDMFRDSNERTVSCEFSCALEYDENEYGRAVDEFGIELGVDNPILGYHMYGITILGKKINPSIKGTEIKVKQFAEMINKEEFSQENLLNMQEQDKEDTMERDGKLFSESAEADKEKDVVMEQAEEKEDKVEETEEKEMAEEVAKECAEEEQEKEMSCENSDEKEMAEEETAEDEKEMAEEECSEKECAEKECAEEETAEEEKKCAEEECSEKECAEKECAEEEKEEEKSMSEMAKEFAETEEDKEYISKLFSCELDNIVGTILELKKFQEGIVAQETEARLNGILANIKGNIEEKKFAEFQAEGKTLTLSELDAFENKVKAFAYDITIAKKFSSEEDEILTFANTDNNVEKADLSANDIFNKYLNTKGE